MPITPSAVTQILARVRLGDARAREDLFALVYDELRAMAEQRMRRERSGHTLEPTDLVHAACSRLLIDDRLTVEDRRQFFGIWVRAMEEVLVDHARRHRARKRGGGRQRVMLDEGHGGIARRTNGDSGLPVEDLAEALAVLERHDAIAGRRKAAAVRSHHLAGLTLERTAELLAVSIETVKRDLRFARAWLREQLEHGD